MNTEICGVHDQLRAGGIEDAFKGFYSMVVAKMKCFFQILAAGCFLCPLNKAAMSYGWEASKNIKQHNWCPPCSQLRHADWGNRAGLPKLGYEARAHRRPQAGRGGICTSWRMAARATKRNDGGLSAAAHALAVGQVARVGHTVQYSVGRS